MERTEPPADGPAPPPIGARAPAFLLAQVGAFAAARFGERLAPLGLAPQHAGVLRLIAASPGINQRTLGHRLGIFPSRLVLLIDQLEQRGLVQRRRHPDDRRHHALHLTDAGRAALVEVGRVAMQHQEDLCAALDAAERAQLAALLQRLAEAHGLAAGVHPGFRTL